MARKDNPGVRLSPLAAAYDHLLLDLDGCVWVGDEATPGAVEAIAALRQGGKRIAFITNNSRQSGEEFVRRLWGLGIQASLEEVVTAGGAVQHVLAERFERGSAVVLGSTALRRHVIDAGLRIVNGTDFAARAAVVVVGLDYELRYSDLRDATLAIHGGAALIAANRDATLPMPEGPWPGSGAILAAVETATGASAEIVGKPQPQLFLTALDRLGPGRTLMIGDRVETDLAGASAAGIDAAIVLTGASSEADARAATDPAPVAVGETLAKLVLGSD
jgi:HAD superfamily hydrolase (TIGR01450 family)